MDQIYCFYSLGNNVYHEIIYSCIKCNFIHVYIICKLLNVRGYYDD